MPEITVIINTVRGDDADALALLAALKAQPAVLASAIVKLAVDLPPGDPPAPPLPLYAATVTATVNVRDEQGNATGEQLQPGQRIEVWSEGSAGQFADRAYIDRPGTGRNVWLKNIRKDAETGGAWIWPVKGAARPLVTAPFNQQRDYGLHEGLDLRIIDSPGKEIVAVAAGTVLEAHAWNGTRKSWDAYGNFVVVQHGKYKVYYCHLQSAAVQAGQAVAQGDLLGIGDSTGNSTGDHLHLHVIDPDAPPNYVFGQRCIDPAPLLPRP